MSKFEIGVGQDFPVREGRKGHRHHHHCHRGHPHRDHHGGHHGSHRKLVAMLLMALGHRHGQAAPERNTP